MMMRSILTLLLLVVFFPSLAAQPLPVEAFANLPDVKQVQLSPNGRYILFVNRFALDDVKGSVLKVYDIKTKKNYIPAFSSNDKYLINWARWANNKQILISTIYPAVRHGVRTTETRLLKVDFDSKKHQNAYSRSFFRKQAYLPQFQDLILDMLPDDDRHILVNFSGEDIRSSQVLSLDMKTGRTTTKQRSKTNITDWVVDRQHNIRIAIKRKDTTYTILVQQVGSQIWEPMWQFESFSQEQIWPIGFDEDPNILYVKAYHNGKLAIFKVDLTQHPKSQKELVFSDPNYDVNGWLIYSHVAKKVIGTTHSANGGYTFWDADYIALQNGLNDVLPNGNNIIVGFSKDERRYILLSSSDTNAGTYYLGDRDKKSLVPIAHRYEALPPEQMATKRKVIYKARDGVNIEAFLTLPNAEPKAHYPTVIHPHGGPISYDGKGFDYWTQFFANRGYAVLQMNFRGSHGYGFEFMSAGLKSWGQQMQTDVEDGTKWMIEQGIADPEHICIVGASYGGYAALMEAAQNSSLYQCAISFAGVTDLPYLVSSHARYTNYSIIKEQIGHDKTQLKKYSPVNLAEKINIPVLLVHGSKDRVVRVEHSRKMHDALVDEKKQVTYIEQKNGNHHLSKEAHRIELFNAMDQFLATYL